MKNWSNLPLSAAEHTLEEVVALGHPWDRHKIGMEVIARSSWRRGERYVLVAHYDTIGHAPRLGEGVECSGLGLGGSEWEVIAVAEGPFIADGQAYVEIRRPDGSIRIPLEPHRSPGGASPAALAALLRARIEGR